MRFDKYKNEVINKTPYTTNLEFGSSIGMFSKHPLMPVCLNNVKEFSSSILKIPKLIKNKFGNMVYVKSFKGEIFYKNENLTDIIFPNSICGCFDEKSFLGCKKLERITIPKTITEIKKDAFKDCVSLKEVFYEGSKEEWEKIKICKEELVKENSELGFFSDRKKVYHNGNDFLLNAKIYYDCKFFDEIENSIYKERYGYTLEELVGKNVLDRLVLIKDYIDTGIVLDLLNKNRNLINYNFVEKNFINVLLKKEIIKKCYNNNIDYYYVTNIIDYKDFLTKFIVEMF